MSRKGTARHARYCQTCHANSTLEMSYLGTKLISRISRIQIFPVSKDTKEVILRKPFSLINRHYLMIQCKGHNCTIIVGRGGGRVRSGKNVRYHSWPMEKILGFKWTKTAQMALKFLCFSRNILKIFQDFSGKLRKF